MERMYNFKLTITQMECFVKTYAISALLDHSEIRGAFGLEWNKKIQLHIQDNI